MRPVHCEVCGRAFDTLERPAREGHPPGMKKGAVAKHYEIRIREFQIDEWEHEVAASQRNIVRLEVCRNCAEFAESSVKVCA